MIFLRTIAPFFFLIVSRLNLFISTLMSVFILLNSDNSQVERHDEELLEEEFELLIEEFSFNFL
tara:strand:- start:292 stop:483 length:192 start_codon:yes stop_codon:yes gene_type:complete